jgi:sortase (surface protein transpeptidase)
MSGELNFMTMDLATYIVSKYCPRTALTTPHEDVSLSNYVYSYTNNTNYHQYQNRKQRNNQQQQQQQQQQDDSTNHHHVIDIVSVNSSRILLSSSVTASWETVNLPKDPRLFQHHLLWGHSIE